MKTLEEYPDYIFSKSGLIYSTKGKKLLSKSLDKKGYERVNLYINGKTKSVFVHRIIAMCYVENPENKPQVNHINGIKSDNRICNLEWCTNKENQNHAFRIGLRTRKKEYTKPVNNKKKILLDTSTGVFYNSITEAANALGYNKGTLKDYISGKRKNKTTLVLA